jgi:hypothetical protein
MQYGANPDLKNRAGKTSFDLLQRPEQNDIEQIMRTAKEIDRSAPKVAVASEQSVIMTLADLLERMTPLAPHPLDE